MLHATCGSSYGRRVQVPCRVEEMEKRLLMFSPTQEAGRRRSTGQWNHFGDSQCGIKWKLGCGQWALSAFVVWIPGPPGWCQLLCRLTVIEDHAGDAVRFDHHDIGDSIMGGDVDALYRYVYVLATLKDMRDFVWLFPIKLAQRTA